MNIGFFTDTYKPQINGVVLSIDLFRAELEKRGHQVYIFAPSFREDKTGEYLVAPRLWGKTGHETDDERVFRYRSMTSVFVKEYPLAVPVSLHNTVQLSRLKLDIVHSHDPFNLGVFADLVAFSKNIPLVHTYHTLYPDYIYYVFRKNFNAPKRLMERLSAVYCNRCDHIITPSEKLRRLLIEYGVTQPMSVLPTGLDVGNFTHLKRKNGQFRSAYQINTQDPLLLFVGRVGKEKNIEFLIRMMPHVIAQKKNARLAIVGDGIDRDRLTALVAELQLQGHVIFTGFLPRTDVMNAYADADVFVFASLTDTQGMVLLEAAAAGIPQVILEDKGLTDAVQDGVNGFVVKADYQIFAQKVLTVLTDQAKADSFSREAKKIAQSFSIERQTDALEKLYEDVRAVHTSSNWRQAFWRELQREIPTERFRQFPLRLTKLFRGRDDSSDAHHEDDISKTDDNA